MPEPPRPEIVCVSTTIAYRNDWLSVSHDEIQRADGSPGVYGVVHKPDFALVVPYERGGFHLVEQFRYPVKERGWEFPQGGWPPGVASAHDGIAAALDLAAHELAEETGLTAASLTPLGYLHAAAGYSDQGFHVVLATDLTPGQSQLEPEEQGLITGFFTVGAVWTMIRNGAVRDAHTVAALALWERHHQAAGPPS